MMPARLAIALLQVSLVTFASARTILTLEQSLRLARENSPALRAADDVLRTLDLSRSELSTTALPQIKAVAGASYAPLPPDFGYDAAISNGGQIAGQIVLQQSIYDGGVRGVKFDQFRIEEDRLARERRRVDRDLTFAVKQSFIELLRAESEITLLRQSVDQLVAYLDLVRRFVAGGNANYTDVLKTELQLTRASLSLQKARESEQTARTTLAELTGTPLDSTVAIVGSLDSLFVVREDTLAHEPATNLDLTIAELGVQRSLLEADVVRRERWPTISLFGDAGYLSSGENLRLPTPERVKALGFSLGIGVEIPLLTWGATGLRVEQRQLEADVLRQQTELLRRSFTSEVRRTRLELANARSRLQSIRSSITKAEENFLLTRSTYAGGATLSLEVLTAQQLLTETKLSELETLASIQLLTARLEHQATQ
jgi:outer membrane protein